MTRDLVGFAPSSPHSPANLGTSGVRGHRLTRSSTIVNNPTCDGFGSKITRRWCFGGTGGTLQPLLCVVYCTLYMIGRPCRSTENGPGPRSGDSFRLSSAVRAVSASWSLLAPPTRARDPPRTASGFHLQNRKWEVAARRTLWRPLTPRPSRRRSSSRKSIPQVLLHLRSQPPCRRYQCSQALPRRLHRKQHQRLKQQSSRSRCLRMPSLSRWSRQHLQHQSLRQHLHRRQTLLRNSCCSSRS